MPHAVHDAAAALRYVKACATAARRHGAHRAVSCRAANWFAVDSSGFPVCSGLLFTSSSFSTSLSILQWLGAGPEVIMVSVAGGGFGAVGGREAWEAR